MRRDLSHIRRIDIEIQSYCNRKCDWCPNKFLDRTFKEEMSDNTYSTLLKQLKEANFGDSKLFHPVKNSEELLIGDTAILSFLGYQEPFSNIELLRKRLNEARNIFDHKMCFVTNTNGDYLSKEALKDLLMTNISIQDYDCKGVDYWRNKFKELGVLEIDFDNKRQILYGISRYAESITVTLDWIDNMELENRGGSLNKDDMPDYKWKKDMQPRTRPCAEPEYFMNIAYDGSVMPCCHLRPDNPNHKEYILGNIKDNNIVDIYYSEKAEDFREKLRYENGDYPEPCKHCHKYRAEDCIGSPSGWSYFYRNGKQVAIKR